MCPKWALLVVLDVNSAICLVVMFHSEVQEWTHIVLDRYIKLVSGALVMPSAAVKVYMYIYLRLVVFRLILSLLSKNIKQVITR